MKMQNITITGELLAGEVEWTGIQSVSSSQVLSERNLNFSTYFESGENLMGSIKYGVRLMQLEKDDLREINDEKWESFVHSLYLFGVIQLPSSIASVNLGTELIYVHNEI